MIKILKHGKRQEPREYTAICQKCDCFFEFSQNETIPLSTLKGERAIICPNCSSSVWSSCWSLQEIEEPEEPKDQMWVFTDDEKIILSAIDKEYNYIVREEDGDLYLCRSKPHRVIYTDETGCLNSNNIYWNAEGAFTDFPFKNKFDTIEWEDKEPCEFRKYI